MGASADWEGGGISDLPYIQACYCAMYHIQYSTVVCTGAGSNQERFQPFQLLLMYCIQISYYCTCIRLAEWAE